MYEIDKIRLSDRYVMCHMSRSSIRRFIWLCVLYTVHWQVSHEFKLFCSASMEAALTLSNTPLDLQITICIFLHPSDILELRPTSLFSSSYLVGSSIFYFFVYILQVHTHLGKKMFTLIKSFSPHTNDFKAKKKELVYAACLARRPSQTSYDKW